MNKDKRVLKFKLIYASIYCDPQEAENELNEFCRNVEVTQWVEVIANEGGRIIWTISYYDKE